MMMMMMMLMTASFVTHPPNEDGVNIDSLSYFDAFNNRLHSYNILSTRDPLTLVKAAGDEESDENEEPS